MDILVGSGSPRLSHLFDIRLSFEVSHEWPVGSGNHIIDSLDGLSEHLLEVLVDLGLGDESHYGCSMLVKGWY